MVAVGCDAGVGADLVSTRVGNSGQRAAASYYTISADDFGARRAVGGGHSSASGLELDSMTTGFRGASANT